MAYKLCIKMCINTLCIKPGIQTMRLHCLKGGYNMLTKCKSFADAFIIQTCGNNKQLDYATPRSTNYACSAVFKQNRFNSA